MSLAVKYAKKVWGRESLCVTWQPDQPIQVGQLVIRSGDTTKVDSKLADIFSDPIPTPTSRAGKAQVTYSDGASLKASVGASAQVAEAKVSLNGKSDFVLAAANGQVREYPEQGAIRQIVRAIDRLDKWNEDWFLITAVYHFQSFKLMIAHDGGGEISVAGAVPHTLDLLHASASLAVSRGNITTFDIPNSTPMFEALRIRKSWRKPAPTVESAPVLRMATMSDVVRDSPNADVVRVTPDDLGLIDDA